MVNISQTFVTYHGCDNCYLDGTRKIVPKNRKCIRPTHYLFLKMPIDVRDRIETRTQIKLNPKVKKTIWKDICITWLFLQKNILVQTKI